MRMHVCVCVCVCVCTLHLQCHAQPVVSLMVSEETVKVLQVSQMLQAKVIVLQVTLQTHAHTHKHPHR
jgi:hypothetical protein